MDSTYLKLSNSPWVYLASMLDLRTHRILTHQISATMDTALLVNERPTCLHTDIGSQFTSFVFEGLFQHHNIAHSYAKLEHSYDNVKIESFHSLLKHKMIYQF
ncbi:hypothetical protein [Leuconostoc gelidum]|uniref:hypothetical protein n=1 Tax=Leuconostoc gelidum TaxID=1244 RepID=UPI0035710D09|nr:transposase family protein [Leuconostoc gelidum subsp. aenigmaticum]